MSEQEFNYGDIIEYIDCTEDLHFEAARDWAKTHNATFNELMDKRDLPKRYFQINEIIVPEPQPPTKEEISALREQAYFKEVDILHAQRQRKTILGTWTEEDEKNYIAEVKQLSEDIANRYPYQNVE